MFFLLREVAGWLLVVASLFLIRECMLFLESRQVIEAGVLSMAAIGIFRGGIHLIRAATAARICLKSQRVSELD